MDRRPRNLEVVFQMTLAAVKNHCRCPDKRSDNGLRQTAESRCATFSGRCHEIVADARKPVAARHGCPRIAPTSVMRTASTLRPSRVAPPGRPRVCMASTLPSNPKRGYIRLHAKRISPWNLSGLIGLEDQRELAKKSAGVRLRFKPALPKAAGSEMARCRPCALNVPARARTQHHAATSNKPEPRPPRISISDALPTLPRQSSSRQPCSRHSTAIPITLFSAAYRS